MCLERGAYMASRMLHYILAVEIANNVMINDMNRFIVGSLITDASSHNDSSYDIAHFENVVKCNDNIKKGIDWTLFENKYGKGIQEDSLYVGYLCHLITDAIWFKRITDKYIRIYPKDARIKYIKRGYEDFQKLNSILLEKYCISSPKLQVSSVDIEEINVNLVDNLIHEMQKDFDVRMQCDKTELVVYPYEAIMEFIDESVSVCVKEINALRDNRKGVDPYVYYVGIN